jgi:hypothetical protein
MAIGVGQPRGKPQEIRRLLGLPPTPTTAPAPDPTTTGGPVVRLGVPQLDAYLEFLAARSRPNTVLAVGYDLRVFFTVVN